MILGLLLALASDLSELPVADLAAGTGTVVPVTSILALADACGEQADIVGQRAVGELGGACAQDGDRLLR
jgi:hypothetical protein